MANPFQVNVLGGLNVGEELRRNRLEQRQVEERQQLEQQRQDMKQAFSDALSGTPESMQRLAEVNPDLFLKMEERQMKRAQKEGEQLANKKREAETNFALRYKQALEAGEDLAPLIKEAIDDPLNDLENSLMGQDPRKDKLVINSILFKNLGKDGYSALIQDGISPTKQAELALKKEANDLRKMEIKQRVLDREISRETNKIKREALEEKLKATKQESAQKQREMQAAAQTAVSSFDNSLSTIERIRNSPGFGAAVGVRIPFLDALPGSDAQETIGLIETLQSQTFLNEVSKMKGMGALSENEGKKLSAAIGSLNRDMSEKAFRKSLDEIESYLKKGREAAKVKFNVSDETQADKDPLGIL